MKKSSLVGAVLVALLVSGCASALRDIEVAERNRIGSLLQGFYARDFEIVVTPFTNRNRLTNFAYLEDALPETLSIILQGMEKDYVPIDVWEYVRLRGFPYALERQILSARVADWEKYTTNAVHMITQMQTRITTNDARILTNILTNTQPTNVIVFQTNLYEKFLKNEFPLLVEEIGRLPIDWSKEAVTLKATNGAPVGVPPVRPTNQASMTNITNGVSTGEAVSNQNQPIIYAYGGKITGSFSIRESRVGPAQVDVQIFLFEEKASETNRMTITIRTTEDKLYEDIMKRRGEIRRFYMGEPLVDVEVVTTPDDVNVYFDGMFIGRTPLVYEGVRPGHYRLQFIREGFETVYYTTQIRAGATNFVRASLQALDLTGVVTVTGETNRKVFLDFLYKGVTPLVISNVALLENHALLVRSDDRNYEDIHYSFSLTPTNPSLSFVVGTGRSVAERTLRRNVAWGLCYGSWGVTLGLIVGHFYVSSQWRHHEDQLFNPHLTPEQRAAYGARVHFYAGWRERLFNYGILSSLASLGITAYALSQEEVYLNYDVVNNRWGLDYVRRF